MLQIFACVSNKKYLFIYLLTLDFIKLVGIGLLYNLYVGNLNSKSNSLYYQLDISPMGDESF